MKSSSVAEVKFEACCQSVNEYKVKTPSTNYETVIWKGILEHGSQF